MRACDGKNGHNSHLVILQVAVILEDTVFENGVMDGEKAPFGKFAGTLRQKLMQEHLAFDTVKDCISETFYKDIWLRRASKNTKLYEEIFDCFPSDKVTMYFRNLNFRLRIQSQVQL